MIYYKHSIYVHGGKMEKIKVDNGQSFDFGKTSVEYAKYRNIYPDVLYDKLYELGVGVKRSSWLDLGTGTGEIPRGLAKHGANIIATDISFEQIEQAKKLSSDFSNITYNAYAAEKIMFPDDYFDVITACQCFWYFDPIIIVEKIRRMIKPNGLFLKIYMSYLKEDPIASQSHLLVKQLNPNWVGGSPAVQDLKTHYFENPQMDSFIIDIPFTRESWHGRIKTCRGVLASMDNQTLKAFEEMHMTILNNFPDEFAVKHKVFLTYYKINK